jgi:hypothetical protein
MKRGGTGLGVGFALLWACASCSSPKGGSEGPSCTVAGMYLATGTVMSGNCPGTTTPVPDTFTVVGSMVNLMFGGMTGAGCTGQLDGCTWTCSAVLMESDAIDATMDELQVQYDYTFTNQGLSGTLTETADPAESLPSGCSGVIAVTATRQ